MSKNTCDTCGKTFNKNCRLIEHIRSHTGERPFKCTHEGCDKTFIREHHLKRHVLVHCGERPFKCKFEGCHQTFTLQHNAKRHEQRAHNQPFKCDVNGCGMSFNKNSKLTKHKDNHIMGKPYRCSVAGCTACFIYPSKLARHLKVHQKEYKCSNDDCGMILGSWSELRKHTLTHKTKPMCEECGQVFSTTRELIKHGTVHLSARTVFTCPKDGCSRSYTKKYNLKVHIRSFHNSEKPHICHYKDCGKTFSHKVSLKNHLIGHISPRKLGKKKAKNKRKRRSLAAKLARYRGKEKTSDSRVESTSSLNDENITASITASAPCETTGHSVQMTNQEESSSSAQMRESKSEASPESPSDTLPRYTTGSSDNPRSREDLCPEPSEAHMDTTDLYLSKERTSQLVQCS